MADRYVATSATPGTDVDGLGGGAVAAGDITDAGTVGVDLVQSETAADALAALGGAAALRALLFGPYDDDMTGTGWSALATSGSATFVWSGGKGTGTCPLGSAASCGVEASGYLDRGEWYDLAIRVDVVTGDTSSATRLVLTAGQSSAANVSTILWANGTIEWGHYGSGSFTSLGTTAGPDSGQRTGGQLWLRITRTPTGVAFAWGVGSASVRPTTWTTVGVSTAAAVLARAGGTYAQIAVLTTSSVAFVADILAITRSLPGGF